MAVASDDVDVTRRVSIHRRAGESKPVGCMLRPRR